MAWVPHDTRDAVMDFVNLWSEKTEIGVGRFIGWLGIGRSKFYDWHARYGRVNEHNGKIPRDFWLEDAAPSRFTLATPASASRRCSAAPKSVKL